MSFQLLRLFTQWKICLLIGLLLILSFFHRRATPLSTNAYIFYATEDTYACSVLINVFFLRHVFHSKLRIITLLSDNIAAFYYDAFSSLDVTVIARSPPALNYDSIGCGRGCLLKLLAFEPFDLEPPVTRAIIMDSDQLILRDLEPVFDIPSSTISAPNAYWINDHTFSSTFMMFQPSSVLWEEIRDALKNIPADTYVMDLINEIFHDRLTDLPPTYGTLNSHWEDNEIPLWFRSSIHDESQSFLARDLRELFTDVHVLHFTAVGKPWMYDTAQLRYMRPEAHPILAEQWAYWRTLALQLCPSGIITHV